VAFYTRDLNIPMLKGTYYFLKRRFSMGSGNPISNLSKSFGNIGSGKNLVGSFLSLSSGGLIGPGDAPTQQPIPSLQDRVNALESAGIFGGMSLKDFQNQNLNFMQAGRDLQNTGVGYTKEAAANAENVLSGKAPSVAQLQFQRGMDDILNSQFSAAQSAPVDPAIAYRAAQDAANQARQRAVLDAAMLRASEQAAARGELGGYGGQLSQVGMNQQGLYGNQLSNTTGELVGTGQQQAAQQFGAGQQQFAANQQDYMNTSNLFSRILGGLAGGAAAYLGTEAGAKAVRLPQGGTSGTRGLVR
jgi:hypothetical protein